MPKLETGELPLVRRAALDRHLVGLFHSIRMRELHTRKERQAAFVMAEHAFRCSIAVMRSYHILGGDDCQGWEDKVERRIEALEKELRRYE